MAVTYFPKKEEASERAAVVRNDPRVRAVEVQLEPYNGWVVVAFPNFHDISDIEDIEIKDGKKRETNKKAPPPMPVDDRPSRAGSGGGKASGTPNQRKAQENAGRQFWLDGPNYRKEGTDGWKALEFLKANPGATAEEIAEAGNFMQHVDYDWKKGKGVRRS